MEKKYLLKVLGAFERGETNDSILQKDLMLLVFREALLLMESYKSNQPYSKVCMTMRRVRRQVCFVQAWQRAKIHSML